MMALFAKKVCAHCGKDAGAMLSYKLADGKNLCLTCGSLRSELMGNDTLKTLTYPDFQDYLKYREENKKKLEEFNYTVTFFNQIHVDMEKGWFVFSKKDPENREKFLAENPDIFEAKDLVFFNSYHINKSEVKKELIGKSVKLDVKMYIAFKSRWYPCAFDGKILKNEKHSVKTKIGLLQDRNIASKNEIQEDLELYLLSILMQNGIAYPTHIGGKLSTNVDLEPYDEYLKKLFELRKLYVIDVTAFEIMMENIAQSPMVRSQIKKTYKR